MKVFCIGPAYSLKKATDLYKKGEFAGHLLYGVNHMTKYGVEVILSNAKNNKLINRINNKFKTKVGDFYEQYDAYRRRNEYDILYGCWDRHIFLLCFLKYIKMYKKPIVALSHSVKNIDSYGRINKILHKIMDNIIYESCNYIISINKLGYETIKSNYGKYSKKLMYIPLAPEIIDSIEGNKDKTTIVAAGKTHRDYETLIKAMSKLNYQCIIICGDGLKKYIGKYKNIRIINSYIPFNKVMEYYRTAKFIVVPVEETEYGMYGYSSILDCLALKKPVIVTDTIGLGIPIKEWGCGVQVKPKSELEMREAIVDMFENDDNYCKYINEIENITSKFNIEEFTKKIIKIISEIELEKRYE